MSFYRKVGNKEVKYEVADSYTNMKVVSDIFENDKGKTYVTVEAPCHRCYGSGQYGSLSIHDGICFACGGSGREYIDVRAYTEEEYRKYVAKKESDALRKETKERLAQEDRLKNEETYRHKAALRCGFGENDCIYVIYGRNAYSIREEIKKLGGKFNYDFGWYFTSPIKNLPAGYSFCKISFTEVYTYDPLQDIAILKENAKDIIKKKIISFLPPSNTEYYPAEIKERLRNLLVKVDTIKTIGNELYGSTNIYTFTLDRYVFVWMTDTVHSELKIGSSIFLTGTIKKFDDFNGVHQTYLSRCIIKES